MILNPGKQLYAPSKTRGIIKMKGVMRGTWIILKKKFKIYFNIAKRVTISSTRVFLAFHRFCLDSLSYWNFYWIGYRWQRMMINISDSFNFITNLIILFRFLDWVYQLKEINKFCMPNFLSKIWITFFLTQCMKWMIGIQKIKKNSWNLKILVNTPPTKYPKPPPIKLNLYLYKSSFWLVWISIDFWVRFSRVYFGNIKMGKTYKKWLIIIIHPE